MAIRTFICFQLRKSSCDRVQPGLVVFSSSCNIFIIKKVWIDFIKRCPRYSKVVKNFIRLYLRKSSCVRVENFGTSISGMCVSNKKTAFNYLYPFSSFSVPKFWRGTDRRTAGRKFFEKVFYLDSFSNFTNKKKKISISFFISILEIAIQIWTYELRYS